MCYDVPGCPQNDYVSVTLDLDLLTLTDESAQDLFSVETQFD